MSGPTATSGCIDAPLVPVTHCSPGQLHDRKMQNPLLGTLGGGHQGPTIKLRAAFDHSAIPKRGGAVDSGAQKRLDPLDDFGWAHVVFLSDPRLVLTRMLDLIAYRRSCSFSLWMGKRSAKL